MLSYPGQPDDYYGKTEMVAHEHNLEMVLTQNKVLWDRYHTAAPQRGDLVLHVLSQVKNLHTSRILDVGCGNGEIAVRLSGHGAQVKAVDMNIGSMPRLKKNILFECIEAENSMNRRRLMTRWSCVTSWSISPTRIWCCKN